jgi:hypothetical protein
MTPGALGSAQGPVSYVVQGFGRLRKIAAWMKDVECRM